jgi:hypothetical protein
MCIYLSQYWKSSQSLLRADSLQNNRKTPSVLVHSEDELMVVPSLGSQVIKSTHQPSNIQISQVYRSTKPGLEFIDQKCRFLPSSWALDFMDLGLEEDSSC